MAELDNAMESIRGSGNARFAGPRDPSLVTAAEEALEVALPPTYRRFVSELGAGAIGGHEFYGVVDANFDDSTIPNGIWLTLDERKRFEFPKDLVIVADTGMGEWYVLDTRRRDQDGECPVAIWVAGESTADDDLEVVAPDFGSFIWQTLQET